MNSGTAHEQAVRVGNSHRHILVQSHWDTIVSSVPHLRSGRIPQCFSQTVYAKTFTFLEESDSESIRRSHRRRAKEIAVSMSRKSTGKTNAATDMTLPRPETQQTVVSKIATRDTGRSFIPTANGQPWPSVQSRNSRAREEDTVQALMDLSLPRFARLEDGALSKTKLWTITEKPPSSPVSARDGNR